MSLSGLLRRPGLVVVGGAFDAVSARLVARSGLDAVWISSLCVSVAKKLVPDANFLGMNEMLEVARSATACTDVPVIVDCENGYGDAQNVAYTVQEFERAHVAAVAIDDNQFPKRNSFYGVNRDLVSVHEMEEKIAVARSARSSPDFLIIARTEALIAGLGPSQALHRARTYEAAGADALIVHSRSWVDIGAFLSTWHGRSSLGVIPTAFPHVSRATLAEANIKIVVYANQALRAAVCAMDEALKQLGTDQGADLEARIAPLSYLEDLVGLPSSFRAARRDDPVQDSSM